MMPRLLEEKAINLYIRLIHFLFQISEVLIKSTPLSFWPLPQGL